MAAAFWLFLAAAASDLVDGWMARRLGSVGKLGSYLDPIADKLLMGASSLTLGFLGHLPLWLVALVISRDLLILLGVSWLCWSRPHPEMEPLFVSKINTVFQLALICVVLARLAELSLPVLDKPMIWAEIALVWLVAITTVISGVAYGNAALRIFKARRPAK